jgi:hypothetical protein
VGVLATTPIARLRRSVVGAKSDFWESEAVRFSSRSRCFDGRLLSGIARWLRNDRSARQYGRCHHFLLSLWSPSSVSAHLQKWQSDVMSSKFDVDVTDPRTDGPRFNTFVTYNLQSTWNTAGVRRRYSDFEWLREVLKYRFHGEARRCPLTAPLHSTADCRSLLMRAIELVAWLALRLCTAAVLPGGGVD